MSEREKQRVSFQTGTKSELKFLSEEVAEFKEARNRTESTDTEHFQSDENAHKEFIEQTNRHLGGVRNVDLFTQGFAANYQGLPGPDRRPRAETAAAMSDEEAHKKFMQQASADLHSNTPIEERRRVRTDTEHFRDDENAHNEFIEQTNQHLGGVRIDAANYQGLPGPDRRSRAETAAAMSAEEAHQKHKQTTKEERRRKRTDTEHFREDENAHNEFIEQTNQHLGGVRIDAANYQGLPGPDRRPRAETAAASQRPRAETRPRVVSDFQDKTDTDLYRADEEAHKKFMQQTNADLHTNTPIEERPLPEKRPLPSHDMDLHSLHSEYKGGDRKHKPPPLTAGAPVAAKIFDPWVHAETKADLAEGRLKAEEGLYRSQHQNFARNGTMVDDKIAAPEIQEAEAEVVASSSHVTYDVVPQTSEAEPGASSNHVVQQAEIVPEHDLDDLLFRKPQAVVKRSSPSWFSFCCSEGQFCISSEPLPPYLRRPDPEGPKCCELGPQPPCGPGIFSTDWENLRSIRPQLYTWSEEACSGSV